MKKQLALIIILCSTSLMYSQKIRIMQGDFDFIKDQKEINVEFVYDNIKILKKNMSNDAYVKQHSAKLEKKSKGKGKAWEKNWMASRELIYAPKFLELMNSYLHEDHNLYFGQELPNTKYTLIVETVWVYPGWDAGIMKQHAKVSTILKFVETTDRGHVLLEINSNSAPGNKFGNVYNDEDRLGEGYAKTGKTLGKLIRKEAF